MTKKERSTRPKYFDDEAGATAFEKALAELLVATQTAIASRYISPEDTQRMTHGGKTVHPGLPNVVDSGIQQHSSVVEVSFNDVVRHDLSAIDRVVQKFEQDMTHQLEQMMYSTVSAACDQTGNVVSAKGAGSMQEAFAQMMEKVEFSVDKYGAVKLPEIHAGSEAYASLRRAFEDAPPEFHERIEKIQARKAFEARAREAERKARFVQYGGEQ
jgi:ferritin